MAVGPFNRQIPIGIQRDVGRGPDVRSALFPSCACITISPADTHHPVIRDLARELKFLAARTGKRIKITADLARVGNRHRPGQDAVCTSVLAVNGLTEACSRAMTRSVYGDLCEPVLGAAVARMADVARTVRTVRKARAPGLW